ncbi:beta strand repeat-containing protein [Leifsonia sp. McL0607]|uniref:beta strand repeat-containing protein n=1 Tax=Leifsonia sp. McL0607 TaxID=3415672 RepID=UPI003CFA2AFC
MLPRPVRAGRLRSRLRGGVAAALSTLLGVSSLVAVSVALPAAPASSAVVCPAENVYLNTAGPNTLREVAADGTVVSSVNLLRSYGDIGFSSDGTHLYAAYALAASTLVEIDRTTGAELSSVTITPSSGPALGNPVALSPTRDGGMLIGFNGNSNVYSVDVTTGVATPIASYPAGFFPTGDFIQLADGDTLMSGSASSGVGVPTTLFRLHPDGTTTAIGTVPTSYGLTQAESVVYTGGPDQTFRSVDSLPTASSTAALPTTAIASMGAAIFGMTSIQDPGCGPYFKQVKTSDQTTYNVGDTVTYTVTATNSRAYTGTADLADALPSTVSPTNVTCTTTAPGTCSGGFTGQNVTGTTTIPPGGTTVFTITATAVAGGLATNTATITPTDPGCQDGSCGGGDASTPPINVIPPQIGSLSIVTHAIPGDQNGDGSVEVGETISYTFDVTNTGNVPLTNVSVVDGLSGSVTCPTTPLAPGATMTCTGDNPHTVTQADLIAGQVSNTGTANGTPPAGVPPVTPATSTATTPVAGSAAGSISLVTTAIPGDENSNGVVDPGETISYTFQVTNTGTVTLNNVTVADQLSGSVTCPTTPLAPGATLTCTGDNPHTVTQADLIAGDVINTGTANATPPAGVPPVTPATSTATTPVAGSAVGSISLVTTAVPGDENSNGVVDPGETISYTFQVTNTGTVTLNNVTVADQLSGSVTCPTGPLAPGATITCTGDNPHTVTEADLIAGDVVNTGTANATPPAGVPAVTPATSTATTPVAGPAAGALSIVTNAIPGDENGNGVVDPGETISYTFTVTNTGNVTVTNLSVVDGLSGSVTCPTAPLAPGATVTCTGDNPHTVTEADIRTGLVSNTGTADGTTPAGVPPLTPVSSTATTPTAAAAGSISLVTTAIPGDENSNGVVDPGETISYTFQVTNTGTVTLNNVTVADQLSGSVTCPTTPLAPGATLTCTGDNPHTVTQADLIAGDVINTGTANATPPAGVPPVTPATSTATTPVAGSAVGSISLVTTAVPGDENSNGVVDPGETISYTFQVTNTGTVTLNNVTVADQLSGSVTCPTGPLAPGATITCTGDNPHTVTEADLIAGDVVNTGTANATPPAGVPAVTPATSTATTPVAGPAAGALSIVTNAIPGDENGNGVVDPGETISYTFEVTNTGNVTVTNLSVVDGLSGSVTCPTAPLAPGATVTCTGDNPHTVTEADILTGLVNNTGTADGTTPAGVPPLTPVSSTATTPTAAAAGSISLVTTAIPGDENGNGVVDLGETISYTFEVTNTGNVTVTNLSVVDGLSGSVTCPTAPLAPGATVTCTGDNPHTVTEADILTGLVSNTGTADGTTPAGVPPLTPVSSTATTPTAAAVAALSIVTTAVPGDENGDGSVDVGETISYTFTVTNTGTVTITDPTVTDQLSGSVTCPTGPLAPGATITCTGDNPHTATDADIVAGQVSNTGTADGTTPVGVTPIVPPTSTVTTPTVVAAAALSIVTTAIPGDENGDGSVDVGETISYTFTVTNTGTVTITDPTVTDQLSGSVTCPTGPLAPGATITCTGDNPHTATDADIVAGQVSNTGTADGTTPVGVTPIVPPTSTVTTPTVVAAAALSIVTTAIPGDENGDGSVDVGETISYTFTVTNTGTVTITDPTVTDQLSGSVTCPTGPLAPGATITCTGDNPHTATDADIVAGQVSNTGTADGTTPVGVTPIFPPTSTVTTPTVVATSSLDIVTTAVPGDENGDGSVDVGETISYTFTVTNTGTVTLTDVTVTDQLSGSVTCPTGPLAPGATITCTGDNPHTVTEADLITGDVANTGTADATTPPGAPGLTPPSSSVTTPVAGTVLGALDIVTTAVPGDENGDGSVDVGETISYTFTVTNTGTVTITDPTVTDQLSGSVTCPTGPLAPGATITCTGDNPYTVTEADIVNGHVPNTGTADGTTPPGVTPITPASSTVSTPTAAANGSLNLVTTAVPGDENGNGKVDAGETISYTFTVTNTGNVTLTDVTVTDQLSGSVTCPTGPLAPGESIVCHGDNAHVVTDAEALLGTVVNTATANATPPAGVDPVSPATSTVTTVVAGPVDTVPNPGGPSGPDGSLADTGGSPVTGPAWWALLAAAALASLSGAALLRRRRRQLR